MRMLRRAAQPNPPLDLRPPPTAPARRHRPRDGEESLPVRQFQPLRQHLAGPLERMMHRPERTGTAMTRKGKARAVQPLANIARMVDPQEEEGDAFLPRLLQRGQPMRGLLETRAELPGQRLHIVTPDRKSTRLNSSH